VAEIERMHVHGQHSLCAQKNEAVPTQAGAGDRRCTCMSYHVSDSQRFHAMPSAYECSKLIPSVPDGSEMTWNLSYHLHAAARLRGEQGAEEKVKTQRFAKSPN